MKRSKEVIYAHGIFLFFCLLLAGTESRAQIELSTGADLNYPVLLNSHNTKMNYGQITFGLRAGVAYKPAETQFFPILNFTIGRTRLPLQQFGQNVAALNFNELNVLLNENYIVRFTQSELFIYGGVGFSYLTRKSINIAGPGGDAMKASIDSFGNITRLFPAMNIGFEYNYGESAGKPLYLTMGIDFQYILLLQGQNNYKITVDQKSGSTDYLTSISGNVISPGFYIALHYLLHLKKQNSMYLN